MGQSFFKKHLSVPHGVDKKNGAAAKSWETPKISSEEKKEVRQNLMPQPKSLTSPEGGGGPTVYGDVDLVRWFGPKTGLQRYKLVEARRPMGRGKDWDAVGMHVGMTKEWVFKYAAAHGISVVDVAEGLKPIEKDDGVVSCEVVGTFPNLEMVAVRIVATGVREIASVPRIDRPSPIDGHTMTIREGFDARWCGKTLAWDGALNQCIYFRKCV